MIEWAIRDYYNSFVNPEDDSKGTQDADRGSPALKSLLAVFCSHDGFEDGESAEITLLSLQSEDVSQVLGKLLSWTRDIYRQLAAYVGRGRLHAGTAEEIAELIEPFIQTSDTPMINIGMTITLRAPSGLLSSLQGKPQIPD